MRSGIAVLFLVLLAFLSAVPVAASQEAGAPTATEVGAAAEIGQEQPIGSGLPERAALPRTMRAYWHVFVAFAVTWLLLFGYALSVGRRFGRLEDELQRVSGDG
ncbi:MAG: CcmD family protein [Gemmatimonadota bacterium]